MNIKTQRLISSGSKRDLTIKEGEKRGREKKIPGELRSYE